jgi:carboxylesterase
MIVKTNLELKGGNHAILMLHGLSGSNLEVARLAQSLHAHGFSVFAPNIEGYCFASQTTPWQDWLEKAQGHLDMMLEQYETVSVLGMSMGATLALALAEQESIASIALLGTAMDYRGWSIPWYRFLLRFGRVFTEFNFTYKEEFPFGVKNPELRAKMKQSYTKRKYAEAGGEEISLKHLIQGDYLIEHVKKNLDGVSSPVIAIHAIEDETCSVRGAERMFEQLSSKQKEFIYLGDSYHLITIDNQRQIVFNEVQRFFSAQINAITHTDAFEIPKIYIKELKRIVAQN